MVIVIDQHVSKLVAKELNKNHTVINVGNFEKDHVWFKNAMNKKANVVISNDKEIANYCYITDIKNITIPKGIAGIKQVNYILKEIERIKNG
jgi:hypothetical protein